MLRVLIVEDSATARQLLIAIVHMDPQMQVCGVAENGREAVEKTKELRPDIILMDIQMPGMNGFEATKIIMAEQPTPIVIVSWHHNVDEISVAMEALRAGALTVLPKPRGVASPRFQKDSEHLLTTIRTMSGVKVRRARSELEKAVPVSMPPRLATPRRKVELVVAAASTGGPAALYQILSELPATFTTPIVIVQHMSQGFIAGLASSLSRATALRVVVAHPPIPIEPRTVYLASSGRHLVVRDQASLGSLQPTARELFCPSADVLFKSAAQVFKSATVALVLTGMGNDGLEGCRAVHAAGGLVAAQDERSSLIFGMPKEAIAAGIAHHVLPLSDIARWLTMLTD